jgi:hypothetical protein
VSRQTIQIEIEREGIVLRAFQDKAPFTAQTLPKIGELKGAYGLDLDASASHRLKERS